MKVNRKTPDKGRPQVALTIQHCTEEIVHWKATWF